MARLNRFKGTSAYVLGDGLGCPDTDGFLLTVFIPWKDDPNNSGYESVQEAIDQEIRQGDVDGRGFFAQYPVDLLSNQSGELERLFQQTRAFIGAQTSMIAFAVMLAPNRAAYLLGRTHDWVQVAFDNWEMPHLANLRLTALDVGQIAGGDSWLQLGTFAFSRRAIPPVDFGECQPILDLKSGKLTFPFVADKTFFNSMNVAQPFTAARRLGGMSQKFIVSETIPVSVFATGDRLADDFQCPLFAALDIFPYSKRFNGQELATFIQRNGFQIGAGGTGRIELTGRDTLGRPLVAILGSEGQYLRIIPTPKLKHKGSDPRITEFFEAGTTLVPHGHFPIVPVSPAKNGKLSRRLKFGPSNMEILEIHEDDGYPSAALWFHINVLQQHANELPTGGFLPHSLVPWARELKVDDNIIWEIQKCPTLTTGSKCLNGSIIDIVTVWPSFSPLNEHGALQPFSVLASMGLPTPTYSVQPDAIVRYAPDSPNATPNSLGYQMEAVTLPGGPLPFTFLEGIPDNPFGNPPKQKKLDRSDLELYLSKHRFEVRKKHWLLAREGLSPLLTQLRDSTPGKPNITPQGFEVIVGESGQARRLVLAKTERDGKVLRLELEILHSHLLDLFLQNSFFLVFPTGNVKEAGEVKTGVKICASVQLGDWGFNLAFDERPPSATPLGNSAIEPNNRSVLILKYQKGPLRKLLLDDTLWNNNFLLDTPWREGAKSALNAWIKTIGDPNDKPKPGFSVIRNILDDESWTGVLMINPAVDIGALPTALQGIVPGIDLAFFRGHHLGFTQNKIETKEGNIPSITKSSLFGLIDYTDSGSFNPSSKFEFRVHTLRAIFANSEVQDFSCLLKVRLSNWFDDDVKIAKGGPDIDPSPPEKDVFGILGRYESFIANGRKINKYSFVWDKDIHLVNDDGWFIFERVTIDRIELRAIESNNEGVGPNQQRIRSELLIDAIVAFKKLGDASLSDILGFEKLELTGLTIPFESLIEKVGDSWKKVDINWKPEFSFDGLSLGTDVERRRDDSLLKSFPLKFKGFRFFDKPRQLSEFKFSSLYTTTGEAFKFAFEWGLDFGALAKMLGLDSNLSGTLLVAWVPGSVGGKAGVSIGLRFDDMGEQRLDIGIGSLLRLRADRFDIFSSSGNNRDGTFIVASNLKANVFGNTFPKNNSNFGLLLRPGKDPLTDPLGWFATLGMKELGFIEGFTLCIGQKFKYIGGETTSQEIVLDVKNKLAPLELESEATREDKYNKSEEFRRDIYTTFEYAPNNDWFIGLGGKAAEIMEGYALYNPPSLFGGEVGIPGWLTVAILYKQETPQLGIYTGTLTLSDELRSIDLGGVRIQIPRICVKFDTDGGHAIIVGLNLEKPDDFSNAAGAEVGIFKGDGGFMSAQIHGSAFKEIPTLKNNSYRNALDKDVYSPITRIMLAARVGLGREFNKGILKAGASITLYGILGGTWGRENVKELKKLGLPNQDIADIQRGLPDQYYKFWGEVGILAEIYGVVDFGVTRQRLDARLLVGIGVTFETLRDTLAYIRGELHISLDWEIARIKLIFKTVEIRVHLSFTTEYREDFVLQKGNLEEWGRWFNLGQIPQIQVLSVAKPVNIPEPDWSRRPSPPGQKVAVPLIVTLDTTLADNGKDGRLVPLVFIPFKTTLDRSLIKDTDDAFRALLILVFDWSLAAFNPPPELSHDTLRAIEREVLKRDWMENIESRGSWEAGNAWEVLLDHFDFRLTLGSEGEIASGTVMILPSGFCYCVEFGDGSNITKSLGGTEVDETYLCQLSKFFAELRMKVDEQRDGNAIDALAEAAPPSPRPLLNFLFEEYMESLLLAVWGRIGMALDRGNWKKTPPTLGQIYDFLVSGNESKAISDMINRQVFSGSRVPMEPGKPREQQTLTAALFEYAELAIDISEWNLKDVESFVLEHELGKVSFEIDPKADATSALSQMQEIKPAFGKLEICQEKPFVVGLGDQYPLIGPVEIDGTSEIVWPIPEALSAKLYDLRWGQKTPKSLKVVLETRVEGEANLIPTHSCEETVISAVGEQHSYAPLVLIALPVADVAAGTFLLRQMAEADRRLLDDFLKSSGNIAPDIEFFAEKREDNGHIAHLIRPQILPAESFIGRVNLSVDPNPTASKVLFSAQFADDLPLRAAPYKDGGQSFLRLVHLAAETNSGGYVLCLSGWSQQGTERIWLGLRLDASVNPILPSYANRILTSVEALPELVLREDAVVEASGQSKSAYQAIPVGEPGVLSATVVRSNPDTLYHVPMQTGPRVLTRAQALSWLETMSRLETSTLLHLDSRGALPANVLDSAGDEEVALAKRFNLLHMEVVGTDEFKEMRGDFDLPAGPERRKDEMDNPNAPYRYRWSVPAHRLLAGDGHADNDLYQKEPEDFIYASIGRAMTVRAGFRDVLGYCPANPDLDAQKKLEEDKYFDPLLSVLSLSGLLVGHKIDPVSGNLHILLQFVPTSLTDKIPIPAEKDEIRLRVRSIRASYTRAMQQIRDKNTIISVESSLGFAAGGNKQTLNSGQRRKLYEDLKTCREKLDELAAVGGGMAAPFDLQCIEFQQAGVVPKKGFAPYQIRWWVERDKKLAWSKIADMTRSKVVSVASDVPLLGQLPEILAKAIADKFPALRLAHTRDGRNEETLYLVDNRLLDIKLDKDRPAFAALTPLSTQPYAKSQARVWNWEKKPGGPDTKPSDNWPKVEISGFDQDAAFFELLRDMDLVLSPASASALWSEPKTAGSVDALLQTKNQLAEFIPKRAQSILEDNADITLIADPKTKDALQRNLENSFKKRLERVAEVDTILAAPFTYDLIGADGQFLLYGSIKTDSNNKNAAQFFPAALQRNGNGNILIVQFDARQPAKQEFYNLPISFCIEYVRADIDGDQSPFGAIWLKLFEAKPVPLHNNGSVEIPVLFKKLLKKPSISIAKSGTLAFQIQDHDSVEEAIKKARHWMFVFDIERTRAATQDDLLLAVVYNSRPLAPSLSSTSATSSREIGEILFEYLFYRNSFKDSIQRLKALVYWSSEAANSLPAHMQPAGFLNDPESVTHHFILDEKRILSVSNPSQLKISLRKKGNWDHCDFDFALGNINANKEPLPSQDDGASDCGVGNDVVLSTIHIPQPAGDVESGEYYAGRRIGIDKLDILKFENAWPSVVIQRNAELGSYKNIHKAFVYQTDRVQPGEPLTPFLDVTQPISLTGESITSALMKLFMVTVGDIEEAKRPLVDLAWGYDSGQLDIYREKGVKEDDGMKVFGRDPIGLFTPRKPLKDFEEEIGIVMESIDKWESNNGGPPSIGRYVFELRVYSRLDKIEKPLLRFKDIRFNLSKFNPSESEQINTDEPLLTEEDI